MVSDKTKGTYSPKQQSPTKPFSLGGFHRYLFLKSPYSSLEFTSIEESPLVSLMLLPFRAASRMTGI